MAKRKKETEEELVPVEAVETTNDGKDKDGDVENPSEKEPTPVEETEEPKIKVIESNLDYKELYHQSLKVIEEKEGVDEELKKLAYMNSVKASKAVQKLNEAIDLINNHIEEFKKTVKEIKDFKKDLL